MVRLRQNVFGTGAALSLLLLSAALPGQLAMRHLEGAVTDTNGQAIERAVVQLKNTDTLQIRSYVTAKDGKYHFSRLNHNVDYELVAHYDGKRSSARTLSRFDSRSKPVIDLNIDLGR